MDTAGGTTPPGTSGEQQAADWVRRMFSAIAPRYDLINHILSFNIDRRWRKALIQSVGPALETPATRVLDLCCGTGDVLLDLQDIANSEIIGADFSHAMLVAARKKLSERRFHAPLLEADALELPLQSDTLDAITIAFGFRNLANYKLGLIELHRVLKPGGKLAILEFSHPPGAAIKAVYGLYSRFFLPLIGTMISGSSEAYTYLPDSIRKFPTAGELNTLMGQVGFTHNTFQLLTGGIAALHVGIKPGICNERMT